MISAPNGPAPRSRARRAATASSVAMAAGLGLIYATRPDACAAITVFPSWAWAVPGLILAAIGLRRRGNRGAGAAVAAWAVFVIGVAEEPRSLLRAIPRPRFLESASPPGRPLRVVSLNCAIGSRLAAEEVAAYKSDVVLLQESPNRGEVDGLARRMFGAEAGVVHGVDASLIVHGRAVAEDLPGNLRGSLVQARVTLADGREVEVISARLIPAVFRVDLWSPDCWREQAENRRARREQMRAIAARVRSTTRPVIVGGDFNAPQGDAVFRLLTPRLRDAFGEGGRGWGNTILNDVPVLRIDQVWISPEFRSRRVVARKTRNSDHRMVICDLLLIGGPG